MVHGQTLAYRAPRMVISIEMVIRRMQVRRALILRTSYRRDYITLYNIGKVGALPTWRVDIFACLNDSKAPPLSEVALL